MGKQLKETHSEEVSVVKDEFQDPQSTSSLVVLENFGDKIHHQDQSDEIPPVSLEVAAHEIDRAQQNAKKLNQMEQDTKKNNPEQTKQNLLKEMLKRAKEKKKRAAENRKQTELRLKNQMTHLEELLQNFSAKLTHISQSRKTSDNLASFFVLVKKVNHLVDTLIVLSQRGIKVPRVPSVSSVTQNVQSHQIKHQRNQIRQKGKESRKKKYPNFSFRLSKITQKIREKTGFIKDRGGERSR
ncbi:hypothetical protein SAMN05444392_1159 [Seinonella peptonophila]|uniref:Uncharacterized protein n=1 Tax=Seinonella peptonophila TaxID=112248 RepID=A0A1M5AN66_9BACL|nr:hypothetical protein [Seinonella peptonophila]SHF31689.1 hypothetical protein SAMN05444392_1159 [Seinonella peptonophila]